MVALPKTVGINIQNMSWISVDTFSFDSMIKTKETRNKKKQTTNKNIWFEFMSLISGRICLIRMDIVQILCMYARTGYFYSIEFRTVVSIKFSIG